MSQPVTVLDGRVVFVGDGDDDPVEVTGGVSAAEFGVIHLFPKGWLWAGYLRDAQGVWWFNSKSRSARLVTPHSEGFRVLDDDYGIDDENVYLETRPVPGADPASFRLVENGTYFACDRRRLYVKDDRHFFGFDDVDASSILANGSYVTDRDHLFHHGDALSYVNDAKDTATVTYSVTGEHDMLLRDWLRKHHSDIVGWWHPDYDKTPDDAERLADSWSRTPNAVFFTESHDYGGAQRLTPNLVGDADPATFTVLDADHGRDTARVYFRWRTIRDADPASFRALGDRFGADDEHVYFNGHVVAGADPATFVPVPAVRAFGKDATRLFRCEFTRTSQPFGHPDEVLVAARDGDPATFRVFGESGVWATDADTVYLRGAPKKKLDAATFRFLVETSTNSWACDANGLYRSNGSPTVAGVDGARFVALNDFWGSDGNVVFSFVSGAVQNAADAATFRVTDDQGGAQDRAATYRIDGGAVRKRKR